MEINKSQEGENLTIKLSGRLDTNTAPQLESEFETSINDSVKNLILDFKNLEYVSSAGLRVILSAKKKISKVSGDMKAKNVNSSVREVFEITGFTDILTLES
ncbi:MAG: STAS domain-containing protein [Oscillospiraceae bacterium]|jgi:anti-sigma B factor antagonist|nr:STAS domain-containing protein [Oscillospiraceae bacterium]